MNVCLEVFRLYAVCPEYNMNLLCSEQFESMILSRLVYGSQLFLANHLQSRQVYDA